MNIGLTWDQSQLDQFAALSPKRLAYATVNAIQATAKRVQQAEFSRAKSAFMIRKQQFFFGTDARVGGVAARITTFPNVAKERYYADIEGGALPGGQVGQRLLYGGFEDGQTREPFTPGAKSVAVPLLGRPARPDISRGIVPAYTFAGMKLQAFYKGTKLTRQTRSRKNLGVGILGEYGRVAIPRGADGIQWRGNNGTFIAFTKKHPLGAVYYRSGSGPDAIRMIWLFEPPFHLDDRLHFVATAQAAAGQFFAEECDRQLKAVLEHEAAKLLPSVL